MSDDHRKRAARRERDLATQKVESWASGRSLEAWLGHIVLISKSAALKKPAEERCCFIRDADNLVRCLTIEFEVELGLGSTVVQSEKSRSELRLFSDWNDGRPETELNFKFYRQATNKIVGISDEAAAFLRGFF